MTKDYNGRNLKVRKKLSKNSAYTRYKATYTSGDLKICGILIEPKGAGPFPMVVLAHGYIDPKVYVSGQGFRREQDWLPRNGYGVLHVDYRNHACSDKDPRSDVNMRLGYAEDVINAALAIRDSDIEWIDGERIALLGRSMGGGVAYQALTIAPGVFDAAITYASVSTNAEDNFNRWQRKRYEIGDRILKKYGEPDDNPEAWKRMSSRNYFFRITEPILAFHGTADDTCEISWARATKRALDRAGVESRLVEYAGPGTTSTGPGATRSSESEGSWTPNSRSRESAQSRAGLLHAERLRVGLLRDRLVVSADDDLIPVDNGTGHDTRAIRQQIHDEIGDLIRLTQLAHRLTRTGLLEPPIRGTVGRSLHHFLTLGDGPPDVDSVDADPVEPMGVSSVLRKPSEAGLASHVRGEVRLASVRCDAQDVHDGSRSRAPLHVLDGSLHHEEGALQVHINVGVEQLRSGVHQAAAARRRGHVRHTVHPSEGGDHLLDEAERGLSVADIRSNESPFGAKR